MVDRLRIAVVCSDPTHPVMPRLRQWCDDWRERADVNLTHRLDDLRNESGDLLFLISCHEVADKRVRDRFGHVLVIHASDLPEGRGWSPLVWQVLEGRDRIVVSLLEAAEAVDAGPVWEKRSFSIEKHETINEINQKLFDCQAALMDFAVENHLAIVPKPQHPSAATYYRRRKPEDSQLDPEATIAEQFDLLRVADNTRYPCFFDFRGHRYQLILRKVGETPDGEQE